MAIGLPPVTFVYSTLATMVPALAVNARPNSVTKPYVPSNSSGTMRSRTARCPVKVGMMSSELKLTGNPPPMSMRRTC